MYESTADVEASSLFEVFHMGVKVESDSVEESQPDIPAEIILLVSCFGDSLCPGHFCSSDIIQEMCF